MLTSWILNIDSFLEGGVWDCVDVVLELVLILINAVQFL